TEEISCGGVPTVSRSLLLGGCHGCPGKKFAEPGTSPSQAGHDRSYGAFHDRGDVLISELLKFTQDDDFAELRGKLLDRDANLLTLEVAYVSCIRIFRGIRHAKGAITGRVELDSFRSDSQVASLIEPNIAQDGKQPALHIAIGPQPCHGAKCAEACFLDEILRFSVIAG